MALAVSGRVSVEETERTQIPSGPEDSRPHQQAGYMAAISINAKSQTLCLATGGGSIYAIGLQGAFAAFTDRPAGMELAIQVEDPSHKYRSATAFTPLRPSIKRPPDV